MTDMPTSELPVSVRVANAFKAEGIATVSDLVKLTERDLLRIPNLGRGSLDEIKEVLSEMGLYLNHRGIRNGQ